MQQVSKVILFFTRRKICRSSEASAQIRRVKERYFTNELHTTFFSTAGLQVQGKNKISKKITILS
jgi:hypothetical protein